MLITGKCWTIRMRGHVNISRHSRIRPSRQANLLSSICIRPHQLRSLCSTTSRIFSWQMSSVNSLMTWRIGNSCLRRYGCSRWVQLSLPALALSSSYLPSSVWTISSSGRASSNYLSLNVSLTCLPTLSGILASLIFHVCYGNSNVQCHSCNRLSHLLSLAISRTSTIDLSRMSRRWGLSIEGREREQQSERLAMKRNWDAIRRMITNCLVPLTQP